MFGQLVNMMTLFYRGRRVWAVFALVICLGSPAQAFYWPGWPGSGITDPPSGKPKEKIDKPKAPFDPPDPKQVPEPATLVLAGLGLGILSLRKAWKRKQQ